MMHTVQSKSGIHGTSVLSKTKPDQPQKTIICITLARQHFDAEKRELKTRVDTVVNYYKAWEESRKWLGPAGDPSLRHTTEMEMLRFKRQFEIAVKPAMYGYTDAVQQAIQYGSFPLSGMRETEERLLRLLIVDALGQNENDDMLVSHSEYADDLEHLAKYAQECWIGQSDPLCFKLVLMCLQLAEIYSAQHAPTIQNLQTRIDSMLSKGDEIRD